jgi:PKD repeat protein
LTVTDTVGQTNTASKTVTLQDNVPVASFNAVVSGYSVTVTSTSTDDHGIASYSWNWGDGSPAGTGASATHTYTAVPPLAQTIVLTVADTVGQTNTASKTVTLQDNAPVAAFVPTPTALVVSVDASTSTDDHGIASYSWNWGDLSAPGSGKVTTHTYGAKGTYPITLTVTDTVGQPNSVTISVTVSGGGPVAAFTATVGADGFTVSVNGAASTGTGTLSYSWNWGDWVTQPGVTATHAYLVTNDYTITLTVTDSTGKGTASQTVSVNNPNLPPLPKTIYGYTWSSDGITPLEGCMLTITDVRTGTTLIVQLASDADGFYSGDILPLYPLAGDTIIVHAIGPAGQTGSGTGVLTGTPYLGISITMSA